MTENTEKITIPKIPDEVKYSKLFDAADILLGISAARAFGKVLTWTNEKTRSANGPDGASIRSHIAIVDGKVWIGCSYGRWASRWLWGWNKGQVKRHLEKCVSIGALHREKHGEAMGQYHKDQTYFYSVNYEWVNDILVPLGIELDDIATNFTISDAESARLCQESAEKYIGIQIDTILDRYPDRYHSGIQIDTIVVSRLIPKWYPKVLLDLKIDKKIDKDKNINTLPEEQVLPDDSDSQDSNFSSLSEKANTENGKDEEDRSVSVTGEEVPPAADKIHGEPKTNESKDHESPTGDGQAPEAHVDFSVKGSGLIEDLPEDSTTAKTAAQPSDKPAAKTKSPSKAYKNEMTGVSGPEIRERYLDLVERYHGPTAALMAVSTKGKAIDLGKVCKAYAKIGITPDHLEAAYVQLKNGYWGDKNLQLSNDALQTKIAEIKDRWTPADAPRPTAKKAESQIEELSPAVKALRANREAQLREARQGQTVAS